MDTWKSPAPTWTLYVPSRVVMVYIEPGFISTTIFGTPSSAESCTPFPFLSSKTFPNRMVELAVSDVSCMVGGVGEKWPFFACA